MQNEKKTFEKCNFLGSILFLMNGAFVTHANCRPLWFRVIYVSNIYPCQSHDGTKVDETESKKKTNETQLEHGIGEKL